MAGTATARAELLWCWGRGCSVNPTEFKEQLSALTAANPDHGAHTALRLLEKQLWMDIHGKQEREKEENFRQQILHLKTCGETPLLTDSNLLLS